MIKLDLKDKRIIYHLNENSRISLTALAKKVQLKKETVNYRIQRLLKSKLIKFQTYLDFTLFGYSFYYVMFRFKSFDKDRQDKVFGYFKAQPNFIWVGATHGKWDIVTQVFVRNINELDSIVGNVLKDLGDALLDYSIIDGIREFLYTAVPDSLYEAMPDVKDSLIASAKKRIVVPQHKALVSIDEVDKKIMALIESNSRLHSTQIAEKIGVSNDTVSYRVRNLEKKGVIVSYMIDIDRNKLDYFGFLLLLKISNLNTIGDSKIIEFLSNLGGVNYASKCSGDFNLLVELQVKSVEELSEKTLRLRGFFGSQLQYVDSLTYFKVHKFSYSPDMLC